MKNALMRQLFSLLLQHEMKNLSLLHTIENPYFIDKNHIKQDVLNYRPEAVNCL